MKIAVLKSIMASLISAILGLLIPANALHGQSNDSLAHTWIAPGVHYGWQLPAADLKHRFGSFFGLGPQLTWWGKKMYWQGSYQYYFGAQVHEDVLQGLRSTDGSVVGSTLIIPAFLRLRGWSTQLMAGKWFNSGHPRWSFGVQAGPGWISHRLKALDESQSHPLLVKPYWSGYDRLSSGPGITGGLAMLYQATAQAWFRLDIHHTLAWTQLRHVQYDGYHENSRRQDRMTSIRISWLWPIALRAQAENIYY